jgi:hypothetical protein
MILAPFMVGAGFTLGSHFESVSAQLGFDEPFSELANLSFRFRMLEAEGLTPVSVAPAPEPDHLSLYGISIGSLVLAAAYRPRRT